MPKLLVLLISLILVQGITANNTCRDQCISGCYFNNRVNECLSCPEGCDKCSDSDTCTACSSGYYMNEGGNCVRCKVNGCAKCNSHYECETCMSGYFRVNSSSCQYCGYLCDTCASPTTCATCRNDTYYGTYFSTKDKTCQYCPDGCVACDSSGNCKKCRDGYVLNGKKKCVTCSSIDSACKSCDATQTTCTECNSGYYLFNNKCLECSAGCNKCVDDATCLECAEGHFVNTNRGCTRCITDCKTCKDENRCLECNDGFEYLEDKHECSPCTNSCIGNLPIEIAICEFPAPPPVLLAPEIVTYQLDASEVSAK